MKNEFGDVTQKNGEKPWVAYYSEEAARSFGAVLAAVRTKDGGTQQITYTCFQQGRGGYSFRDKEEVYVGPKDGVTALRRIPGRDNTPASIPMKDRGPF